METKIITLRVSPYRFSLLFSSLEETGKASERLNLHNGFDSSQEKNPCDEASQMFLSQPISEQSSLHSHLTSSNLRFDTNFIHSRQVETIHPSQMHKPLPLSVAQPPGESLQPQEQFEYSVVLDQLWAKHEDLWHYSTPLGNRNQLLSSSQSGIDEAEQGYIDEFVLTPAVGSENSYLTPESLPRSTSWNLGIHDEQAPDLSSFPLSEFRKYRQESFNFDTFDNFNEDITFLNDQDHLHVADGDIKGETIGTSRALDEAVWAAQSQRLNGSAECLGVMRSKEGSGVDPVDMIASGCLNLENIDDGTPGNGVGSRSTLSGTYQVSAWGRILAEIERKAEYVKRFRELRMELNTQDANFCALEAERRGRERGDFEEGASDQGQFDGLGYYRRGVFVQGRTCRVIRLPCGLVSACTWDGLLWRSSMKQKPQMDSDCLKDTCKSATNTLDLDSIAFQSPGGLQAGERN